MLIHRLNCGEGRREVEAGDKAGAVWNGLVDDFNLHAGRMELRFGEIHHLNQLRAAFQIAVENGRHLAGNTNKAKPPCRPHQSPVVLGGVLARLVKRLARLIVSLMVN